MSPRRNHQNYTKLSRLLIPAGRPPVQLTWPEPTVGGEPVEQSEPRHGGDLGASLVEAMENSTTPVLKTSSEALSSTVSARRPHSGTSGARSGGTDVGDLPTDEALVTWANACREKMRAQNYYLSREGLQYWLRYFFDPSTDRERWAYARERLGSLVRE